MTVAHGTWRLRSLLQGDGTPYCRTGPIGGLGVSRPRRAQTARGNLDGDVAGCETLPPKVLTFPMTVTAVTGCAPTESEAESVRRAQALKLAWNRNTLFTSSEVELELGQRGFPSTDETLRFYGRVHGLDLDYSMQRIGALSAFASFLALDPFGYGPAIVVTGASPIVFSNIGDVPTDRFTVTIVGSGSTPVLTSVTDNGNTLAFAAGFSGTAILDFHTRSLTVGGVDSYGLLTPAPEWFSLLAGSNTITWSGATSVSISYQPAYL